ncbi:MAG: hypothetical protein ACK5RO_06695 [Pseudobdellovibrionaceae bacterium]
MSDWKKRAKPVEDWKLRATPVEEADIPIVDERTPYVSAEDRAIAKNFAQSTQKQAEFLKQKYPGLEVKVMGDSVAVRKPEDAEFKVLDPNKLELEDITDLGDTVVGGVASTLGAIGGGTAGALAGPAGAVGGGMAGSAAAGAGFEALRQKLGAALGIPQEVDTGDVATAGAINALGVGLLGQPATKAGSALVSNAKGISKEAAEQLVNNQGLVRTAWNKGMPAFTNMWFGTTDDVLNAYVNPATREGVDQLAEGSKTEFTDSLVSRIRGALSGEKRKVGEALASSIDGAGSPVNLSEAKQAFEAQIQQLDEVFKQVPTPENKAALDSAKQAYGSLFSKVGTETPEVIDDAIKPSLAWRLQQQLKDYGDLKKIGSGINPRYASNATADEKALSDAALTSYRAIGKELDRVTDGASPALKKQYGELMDIQDNISPYLKTDQSAYTTFKNSDSSAKTAFREALERLEQKTGEKFKDDIIKLQSAEYFGSNSLVPKSIGGTTSTSRSLPATFVGGLVGGSIGAKTLGPMGAAMGGAIGMAGGNALASPVLLRNVIRSTDPLRSGANAISPYLVPLTPATRESVNSIWRDVE